MEINKSIQRLLRFVDSDMYSIYTDMLEWTNTSIYVLDSEVIEHPLKGFVWCSYSTMADRLSMNRITIGKKIDELVDLGLITKYSYNFILKDRLKALENFNNIEIPRINSFFKMEHTKDPISKELRNIQEVRMTCRINKTFIKIVDDIEMPFLDFKLKLLSYLRSKAREVKTKHILSNDTIGMLIHKNSNRVLEGESFKNIQTYINKVTKEDKDLKDLKLDYESFEDMFNKMKGKLSFNDYTYISSFETAIHMMSEIVKTSPIVEIEGSTYNLHKLQWDIFIEKIAGIYGINELLESVSGGRYLFYFMLEVYLRQAKKEDVVLAWGSFKKTHFNWRTMNVVHLTRSLRKYIHNTIINSDVEKNKKLQAKTDWYYVKKASSLLTLPPVLQPFKDDIKALDFFSNSYYKSDTGEIIYPFYFFNDYSILSKQGKPIYPDWKEIIRKCGGDEKKKLIALYEEIQPMIQEEEKRLRKNT